MGLFNFKKKEKKLREPLDPLLLDQKIRNFIGSKSKIIQPSELTPATLLFTSGLLDSLTYIQLVTFLQSEFDIRLSDVIEVNGDNLDSLERILKAVNAAY